MSSSAIAPAGSGPAWAGASVERRPELDALRGVAAVMVLIEHAQLMVPPVPTPDIPGAGFLRWVLFEHTPLRILDVGRPAVLFFFVLSGYVLTRALLASGSPGLSAFAVQRTVRLMLPVAASVLLSVALYAVFFDPEALPALRDRTLNTWLEPPTVGQVIGNALLLSTAEELRLNIPLWSLVQEWRLTVLLPFVLLFRGRALQLLVLCFALMIAGQMLGAREDEIQLGHDLRGSVASTLYFALGIGSGVVLALAGPLPAPGPRQRALLLVLTAILFSMKSDLATYAGSAILIVVAQQPGMFRRVLRWPVTVWLGRISFSLYLVHVPILVATAYALHAVMEPVAAATVGGLLSLPAAALMRAAVEEPSRRLARQAERRLARQPPRRRATQPLTQGAPGD
jgi:peptidoglycan/LPS O-acetylase OafA/YrhL